MRTALLPLHRVRLELDRSLRGRAFFARAIRGDLEDEEYVDLVSQLGALLAQASNEHSTELLALASLDAKRVSRTRATRSLTPPCTAVSLFGSVARSPVHGLTSTLAFDVCITVIATSWIQDSAERLARRRPRASSLVADLATRSPLSLARIESSLDASSLEAHDAYAFAELTRGALLGLATHLDVTWPAPIFVIGLPAEE